MPEQDGTLPWQQYHTAFGNPQPTHAKRSNGGTHLFEIDGRWTGTRPSKSEPQSCNHNPHGLPPDNTTLYAVSWEPLNTGTPIHISVPPQTHAQIMQYGAANEHYASDDITALLPCSTCRKPAPYYNCPHLCPECTRQSETTASFQQTVFTTTHAVPETWKQPQTQKTITPSDPVPLQQNQDGSYGPRHLLPTLAGGLVLHPDSLVSTTRLQYTHTHAIAWNVPLYDYGPVYVVPPKCTHCI